jgi:hypothetical protein
MSHKRKMSCWLKMLEWTSINLSVQTEPALFVWYRSDRCFRVDFFRVKKAYKLFYQNWRDVSIAFVFIIKTLLFEEFYLVIY